MRVQLKGVERRESGFSIFYDGEELQAFSGETVAAALSGAGRVAYREAREGERRGIFCGMGVCGECTVLIDGRARRACMEMATPGMHVERQLPRRQLPGEAALAEGLTVGEWQRRDEEILIIGAGPAGLSAARSAALCGARVLVVDERAKAGGQYFKQPGTGFEVDEAKIDAQFREGRALYRSARDAGVEFLFGATVWGAFSGPEIAVSTSSGSCVIRAQRVVIASGAYERPLPFPGWTLPGVMTTGAAQTLLRAYQTAPGKRVLVAGNGPLNLQVARELVAAGVDVVAVVELSAAPALRNSFDFIQMLRSSPGLVMDGIGHLLRLARAGVPMLYEHVVSEARGDARVTSVTVTRVDSAGRPQTDSERHFEVDAVCLGYGFFAQSEIARSLGAQRGIRDSAATTTSDRHADGQSGRTQEAFVIGDARGLGGARVAMSEGTLAGVEAAQDLGYGTSAIADLDLDGQIRALRRHRRFQKSLWAMYDTPLSTALAVATRDTTICRCESVARGTLEDAIDAGLSSVGAIKRETRAGMGRCQGRYCAAAITQMLREAQCELNDDDAFFAPRPPFKPITVGDLATTFDASAAFDRSAGGELP